MADDRGHQEKSPLTPDEVAQHEFITTFRGYDPNEVRSFLERVSGRLRALEELTRGLRGRLAQMQAQASAPPPAQPAPAAPAAPAAPVDEATLLSALGEQAAHVLRSAHEAADSVTRRADDEARQKLETAEAEANRVRLEAEAIKSARIREADAEAAVVVAKAQEDGERIRVTATAEAERIAAEGRHRGREIVEEAQAVRERVLGDLMKRRRVAQVQIEQLRAGRERLIEAYRVVRRTLDDVTDELQRADAEARAAAEAAGKRLAGEPGRSLPTVPGAASPAGGSRNTPPAPSPPAPARDAESAPRRTFAPRPEPGPARGTGNAGGGAGAGARPAIRPRTEAPRIVDSMAPSENVRILGRTPSPVRPEPEPEAEAEQEPEPESEPEPEPLDEAIPAFPGMDDEEAEIAVLDEVIVVERTLTEWESAPAVEARAEPEPEPQPQPDPQAEPEPLAEPVSVLEAEPEPQPEPGAVEEPAVEEPAESEPEPEPEPEPAAEAEPELEPEAVVEAADAAARRGRPELDQLFARIRSERAEAVARAHEVLGSGSDGERTESAPAAAEASPAEVGAAVTVVDDSDESALQRRDHALDSVLDAMTRKLKRAMQDEQNDLLDRLRSVRSRPRADALLLSPQSQADRFRNAALPYLADAAAAGVAFYDGRVGDPVAVNDLAENLAFSIVGPLRRRLESALAEGQPDDAGTLAEHIGAAYREWKTQRIEQIAGDHAVAAFSRGILESASPRSTWRWVVDDQGTPCPDCDDNGLAGAVPANESFPTGQLHPPAHTGCRCLLVPVVP